MPTEKEIKEVTQVTPEAPAVADEPTPDLDLIVPDNDPNRRSRIKKMNLYEKMGAITAELGYVAKNLNVGDKYKATGEADVLAAVKPLEAKYRVYSWPLDRTIVEAAIMTTVKSYTDSKTGNVTTTESPNNFMRIETIYRAVNMDDCSEYIDTKSYGDGVDPQDKAPGKAMTYSDKYALNKLYKIQTGEDPDAELSNPMKNKESARATYTGRTQAPKPAANTTQGKANTPTPDKQRAVSPETASNETPQAKEPAANAHPKATNHQVAELARLLTSDEVKQTLDYYKIKGLNEIREDHAAGIIKKKTGETK